MNRRRIIQLCGREVRLTPKSVLDFRHTNFPDELFGFHETNSMYWEIEIEDYRPETGEIVAKVSDYEPMDTSSFHEQALRRPLHSIIFKELEWSHLQPCLSMYNKKDLLHLLAAEDTPPPEQKQKTDLLTFDFTYAFEEAEFSLGFVAIQQYFSYFDQTLDIRIYNSDIMPEYHLIRKFFPRAFDGKKKFNVHIEIEHKGRELIDIHANSPEINAIDDRIIETVKQYRSLQLSQSPADISVDKSLFTSDELSSPLDDQDSNGNAYSQDAKDILKCLLSVKDARNKKQLEYLAAHQQSGEEKIRFTLHPLFGFLFTIEGQRKTHFCWELLDSHATYLWSVDKTGARSKQIRRIEKTISLIREVGRKSYKTAIRRHELDTDLIFNVISHHKANSPVIDGFVYWKRELKALLV